jgi:hypothetical protein
MTHALEGHGINIYNEISKAQKSFLKKGIDFFPLNGQNLGQFSFFFVLASLKVLINESNRGINQKQS